jgi:hypothetical protein
MKRLLLLPAVLILGVAGWAALFYSQSSPRVDYVSTMRTITYNLETGAQSKRTETIFGQSADGASIQHSHDNGMTETIDPLTREVRLADNLTKEYITQPLSAQSVSHRLSPVPDSCEAMFHLPCTDGPVILGHPTKTFKLTTGPCNSSTPDCHVSDVSVAKDLNWGRLASETRIGGKLSHKHEVVSITLGGFSAYRPDLRSYRHMKDIGAFTENGMAARGLPNYPKEKLDAIRKRQLEKELNIRASYSIAGQLRHWLNRALAAL